MENRQECTLYTKNLACLRFLISESLHAMVMQFHINEAIFFLTENFLRSPPPEETKLIFFKFIESSAILGFHQSCDQN